VISGREYLMHALRHHLIWLLLVLLPASTSAAGLTEAQVRGTLGAIQELEETFGQARGGQGPGVDPRAFAGSQADVDTALAILRRHGFTGVEEWTAVAQRVVNAYMAVKFADEQPDAEAELARARAEIEASDMSPEQKQQMLAMLARSLDSMRAMTSAPAEDVATVRGMLPELDAYFEP
jgi:hypothetical protein